MDELILRIPAHDPEEGTTVYWGPESRCHIRVAGNAVCLQGNTAAFMDLARQLMELAASPKGSHVHLDDFICGDSFTGCELIISKDLD